MRSGQNQRLRVRGQCATVRQVKSRGGAVDLPSASLIFRLHRPIFRGSGFPQPPGNTNQLPATAVKRRAVDLHVAPVRSLPDGGNSTQGLTGVKAPQHPRRGKATPIHRIWRNAVLAGVSYVAIFRVAKTRYSDSSWYNTVSTLRFRTGLCDWLIIIDGVFGVDGICSTYSGFPSLKE